MNIKRLLSAVIVFSLLLSLALPIFSMGRPVIENNDFIKADSAVIGWDSYPLTVFADGSFNVSDTESVSFGATVYKKSITFEERPYPVSTHSFEADGLSYLITQFVYCNESSEYFVYSRLTLKNLSDVAIPYPAVTGTAPLSEPPAEIGHKKSVTVDYVYTFPKADAAAETPAIVPYETAKANMIAHWDALLDSALSISGAPDAYASTIADYEGGLIEYAISGTCEDLAAFALSSRENAASVLKNNVSDAYALALALMKTGDRESAIPALSTLEYIADDITFETNTLPYPSLKENLSALLSLQSYAYVLKALATEEESFETEIAEAREKALTLSENITTAINNAEATLSCDWEAADTDISYGIVLCGENFESASDLCNWYVRSSVFTDGVSKELVLLAKDANDYCRESTDCAAFILSLFTEREDGSLIIGRGAHADLIKKGVSLTCKSIGLSTGGNVSLSINHPKKSIDLSIIGIISAPVQIEFFAFENNLEFSSAGFDSETGIITVPEGNPQVSVRLIKSADSLKKELFASADLERAIANALGKKVESPTTVSKSAFDKALSKATKARTATVEEKNQCAKALETATAELSPMVASYTYTVSNANDIVGHLVNSEVYQKFTLPESGTVDCLYVKGAYTDGISAAVYTLRGNEYTTDELCAETYGVVDEKGIRFDLDFKAEGEKVYVLCIFSEYSDVNLTLESSDTAFAHTTTLGQTEIYNGASLSLEFHVRQADRTKLDTFYTSCLEADLSDFTKESQKELKKHMNVAKAVLCSPTISEKDYKKVYDDLKDSFDGLDTYASEDKIEETPVIGIVLIVIVFILLIATFVSAMYARKKMNEK